MVNSVVRLAQVDDYEAVEAIMKQVQELHVKWRPDIYKECKVVLAYEEFLESVKEESMLVALQEEKVVGILAFVYRQVGSDKQVARKVLFIDAMAVDETYRGRGIGHQLLDMVKVIAKEQNCDGVELQVNARNVWAKATYESWGFTEKSINMELL